MRTVNVLTEPVLSVSGSGSVSLPGLLSAMAGGRVGGFPALRPHQRPAWHMFLVQLAALAVWRGAGGGIPESEAAWTDALRRLTPEHGDDAPWRLTVLDGRKPAFLQPAEPGNADKLKWRQATTPDALDMLITARNHDLKSAVAREAAAEDWIYALVSLQTCAGYGGGGNYGIARMNGGSSSRPMLGLAPAREGDLYPDPSAWWRRDVERLLEARKAGGAGGDPKPALVWCLEWAEGRQLTLDDVDPWFIEVCRRVRLDWAEGRLVARRSTSRKPRIASRSFQGSTGDPWAPLHGLEDKSLTLGSGAFGCKRLCELLFSGEWELPLLCRRGAGESGAMLLVAEAFSRGNIKTEGFQSRIVPVPEDAVPLLAPGTPAAALAAAQVGEMQTFDHALRDALALMAAGGGEARKEHYRYTFAARDRFGHRADGLFFGSLWQRVRAQAEGETAECEAKAAFLAHLLQIAVAELEAALPAMPCPAAVRPLAGERARRRLRNRLWGAWHGFLERELRGFLDPDAENGEPDGAAAEAARAAAGMLQGLAPRALAEARHKDDRAGSPAFWRLAACHPGTIGQPGRRDEWMAIVRILAILAEGSAEPGVAERRLGEALCDGGDPRAWPARSGRVPHPAFSERRMAQLLAARGKRRAALLERAARALARSRSPGSGVDPADVARAMLAPEDDQRLAGPYCQRLDRARWDVEQIGKGAE